MKEGAIMRRIYFGTGSLVLGLAMLMWVTAPSSAQHGGHASSGHIAPAHIGSVHYGARPAPVHVAPVRVAPPVRTGTIRSEHYAGSVARGAYRNPYRDEYFRHFRAGYRPFLLGDAQYYGYDSLPVDCPPVVLNEITYYLCDGVYYQPYIYGGQTVYLVVPTQ
jgi:hypothetical protein